MSVKTPRSSPPGGRQGKAGVPAGRGWWWAAGQVVLMGVVAAAGWLLPGERAAAWAGWPAVVAGALGLAGAIVGVAGAAGLRGGRTIFPEPPEGAGLVETGIYRHIRHPLYLSLILLALAWGCWRHSPWCLLAGAVLAGFLDLKATAEERRLCRRFAAYPAYQERTWRFLPGLW